MGDVVNLRRMRKAKLRADDAAKADAARLRHGRSKSERTAATLEQQRAARDLEAHRRGEPEPDDQP